MTEGRFVMLRAVLVALTLVASAHQSFGHDWYTGLHNEKGETCCGGQDCAPLADNDVAVVPGGYLIKHLMVTVPTARARPSESMDGHYHSCVWGGEVKCFFFPGSGS